MKPIPALAILALLQPVTALAQLPEPLDPTLFSFPGAMANPPSAVSAGVALADLWLGDEPFHNPAIRPARRVEVSPLFQRISRQDLRAQNRSYDEQPAFFDAAGASLAFPLGTLAMALYGYQPTLRLEDNAFERGERGGPVPPAVVQTTSTMREWRAGLALAATVGALRLGGAAEWTGRSDDYEFHEQSGSPDAGDRLASFSGSGLGFQGGMRWQSPEVWGGPLSIGLAARYLPELAMEGEQTLATPLRDTMFAIGATLESGVEGGLSVGFSPKRALGVVAGVGFQSERAWRGFGVTSAKSVLWSFGFEYHEAEEPWTFRAGYGQERSTGDPEPRVSMLGIGTSWGWEGWGLDIGILHRSFEREPHPTSVDDRLVATLRFDL